MNERDNIIAMIPARIGSTRLKMKNLALLNGQPMIAYAIEAAKASGVFSRIVVNSDNDVFAEIAKRHGVEFYLRPLELGSSNAKSDNVVYDFMLKHKADITVWVNPISPLQTGDEIREIIDYFVMNKLDTLITVKKEYVHSVYENNPVNFNKDDKFAKTQDLEPVQTFVYSIMMWKSKPFVKSMKDKGYAFFLGKVGYYPVSKLTSIIVKTSADLKLIEFILKSKQMINEDFLYDEVVHRL